MHGHGRLLTPATSGRVSDPLPMLQLLSSAQTLLASDPNPVGTLPQITRLLVPDYADLCAIYVLDANDHLRLATVHTTPCMANAPCALERVLLAQSTGVLQTRQTLLAPDLWSADDVLADVARAHVISLSSALYVPMHVHGHPVGVICMLRGRTNAQYDRRECAVVEHLAAAIALSLDHARLRTLQRLRPESSDEHAVLMTLTQMLDAPAALHGPAPDYCCRWHNAAFLHLVRPSWHADDSVVGLALHDLVDAATYAAIQRHITALQAGPWVANALPNTAQPEQRAAWNVWPLHDCAGTQAGLLLLSTHSRTEHHETYQQQLLVAQKLESLGLFASGIAHDLNNILTVVQGNVELALMDVGPADGVLLGQYLTTIETASHRATDLVRQILAYANTRRDDSQPIQLNQLIEEMDDLLHVSISKQITLAYHLAPDLPVIAGNVTQIRQVILNLMINAVDAIGANRGQITIRTGRQTELHNGHPLQHGDWIVLEISDSGCGMDAATMKTIFEPFFTTKPTGCGLGLAAVQSIIQAHAGQIAVTSQPGHGTTFRLLVPCMDQTGGFLVPCAQAATWRGRGTILVIDDDGAVRHTIRRMVETLGFTVLEAASGLEGLRCLAAQKREIDTVLVDVTMPGLNGYEIRALIGTSVPSMPVILMTGGDAPHRQEDGQGVAAEPRVIQKPLTVGMLRDTFAAVLPSRCLIGA